MMTLKHITPEGHERVITLASVSFDPETKILIGHGIVDHTGLSKTQEWSDGRAYVMNDHGKTVATYYLNKKEQP